MRLIRCGDPGHERPGVELKDGSRFDLSSELPDYNSDFFAAGGIAHLRTLLDQRRKWPRFPPDIRMGPPVARPYKFLAVGLNYRTHAEEMGLPIPEEPEIFTKQTSSLCGPFDDIMIPRGSRKLDYENEMAFVVQCRASYLTDEIDAVSCIGGYLVCNDGTARDFTARGSQWTKGKSSDTFGALGPWLVTPDELSHPHRLGIRTLVNNEIRQDGSTGDMIFTCPYVLWYLSQFMPLEPGDVITTGTPPGVAGGMNDPDAFLKDGDVLELSVEGLGSQRHQIRSA